MPALMAFAKLVVSATLARFTVTVIALPAPPENPGPEIVNVVLAGLPCAPKMAETLVPWTLEALRS